MMNDSTLCDRTLVDQLQVSFSAGSETLSSMYGNRSFVVKVGSEGKEHFRRPLHQK